MRVLVFLAEGFEEAEALCPVDVFKRAGYEVVLAGVDKLEVASSHGITIKADTTVEEIKENDFDCVFCPGGMPGAVNLSQSWRVNEILIESVNSERVVSAICASPAVVLGPLGLLNGKNATCYPGCESYSPQLEFLSDGVVVDGNIVTGKSAGYAFDLGLKIVELLSGVDVANKVQASIFYKE